MSASTAPLPDATRLALDRTRLAYERTLMAWVRTSASLISFGFTFYKFFQAFSDSQQRAVPERFISTRGAALLLISVGVFGLMLARSSIGATFSSFAPNMVMSQRPSPASWRRSSRCSACSAWRPCSFVCREVRGTASRRAKSCEWRSCFGVDGQSAPLHSGLGY